MHVADQVRAEPPRGHAAAKSRPGSKPEPGIPGRVPKGSAPSGLRCNTELVAHQGTSGGFKVLRYVDTAGHECAFYDTALLSPINALNLDPARRSAWPCSTCPIRPTRSRPPR